MTTRFRSEIEEDELYIENQRESLLLDRIKKIIKQIKKNDEADVCLISDAFDLILNRLTDDQLEVYKDDIKMLMMSIKSHKVYGCNQLLKTCNQLSNNNSIRNICLNIKNNYYFWYEILLDIEPLIEPILTNETKIKRFPINEYCFDTLIPYGNNNTNLYQLDVNELDPENTNDNMFRLWVRVVCMGNTLVSMLRRGVGITDRVIDLLDAYALFPPSEGNTDIWISDQHYDDKSEIISVHAHRYNLFMIPEILYTPQYQYLEELVINGNLLTTVPSDLSILQMLTVLNLSFNRIKYISEYIVNLENLVVIDLSKNLIFNDISFLYYLENLEILNLSHNYIRYVITENILNNNLKVLNLSSNNISGLSKYILNFKNIVEIDLSKNNIGDDISFLFDLQNLETLNLSNNYIQYLIKDEIGNETWFSSPTYDKSNLKHLYLNNNYLEQFPLSILLLPKLIDVNIKNNSFGSIIIDSDMISELELDDDQKIIFVSIINLISAALGSQTSNITYNNFEQLLDVGSISIMA